MQLLPNFDMPPFARTQWTSEKAHSAWNSRLHQAASAYGQLEWETIRAGVRECTTTHVNPDNMGHDARIWANRGLTLLPYQRVGSYSGFAHRHPPVEEGRPWSWYSIVGRTIEAAESFAHASDIGDHEAIGDLLGYPTCCQQFFNRVWGAGYIDPIWQAAERTRKDCINKETPSHILIKRHAALTLFEGMRYIGIRLAPHLTCSLSCMPSVKMVRDWIKIGNEANIAGLTDLVRFFEMPVRWSCLKGIAVIDTPLFRIVTNSMACPIEHIVDKEGDWIPEESATGNRFPFPRKTI